MLLVRAHFGAVFQHFLSTEQVYCTSRAYRNFLVITADPVTRIVQILDAVNLVRAAVHKDDSEYEKSNNPGLHFRFADTAIYEAGTGSKIVQTKLFVGEDPLSSEELMKYECVERRKYDDDALTVTTNTFKCGSVMFYLRSEIENQNHFEIEVRPLGSCRAPVFSSLNYRQF